MQDGKHRAITGGIQKLVGMPTGGQRACFRFAVAHNAADQQIWIVESSAVGVRNGVSELAAFVDRTGSFGSDMAGNSARKRKLLEQPPEPIFRLRNAGIKLAVGAFQISVGNQPGTSVSRACNIDDVKIVLRDESIQMYVDEIQSWRSAPMAQKAGLNVLYGKRFAQQGIGIQINLSHGEVIRGAPVGMDLS